MKHSIYKIVTVKVVSPFTLDIVFDDGAKRTINFLPILKGEMYGPLANEDFFKKVYLDTEVHTITWPNNADFNPEILYNWDMYKDELLKRSETWSS